MKSGDHISREKRQESMPKNIILWIAATAVVLGIILPCFYRIWGNRAQVNAVAECTVLADAALKQAKLNQDSLETQEQELLQSDTHVNMVIGWLLLYGDADQETVDQYREEFLFLPDATVIRREDGSCEPLYGEIPEEEFERVAEKAEAVYTSWDQDSTRPVLTMSAVVRDGDHQYLVSTFPLAAATIITRQKAGTLREGKEITSLSNASRAPEGGSLILVSLDTGDVIQVIGKKLVKTKQTLKIDPDENGKTKIGKRNYLAASADSDAYRVYAIVPASRAISKRSLTPVIASILFSVLFLLVLLYAWFLCVDIQRGRVEQGWRKAGEREIVAAVRRRVRMVYYICCVCVVLIVLLICSLIVVDGRRTWGLDILKDVENYYVEDDAAKNNRRDTKRISNQEYAQLIADAMNRCPEVMEEEALADLGYAAGRDVCILNDKGEVLKASTDGYDFSGLDDKDSEWYALKPVLEKQANLKEITIKEDGGKYVCQTARIGDTDQVMVLGEYRKSEDPEASFYADFSVPDGMTLFALDPETGVIVASSGGDYCGVEARMIGITDEVLADNFAGNITLDGKSCFVQTNVQKSCVSILAVDLTNLTGKYVRAALTMCLLGVLVTGLMLLLVFLLQRGFWNRMMLPETGDEGYRKKTGTTTERKTEERIEKKPGKKIEEAAGIRAGTEAGMKDGTEDAEDAEGDEDEEYYSEKKGALLARQSAAGRWMHARTPFQKKSADEKFVLLTIVFAVSFLAGCFLYYHFRGGSGIMHSVVAYLFQGTWNRGLNIYAVTYAILMVLFIMLIATILRGIVLRAGQYFGSRGETIARLIGSFIRYASLLGAIGYSLMFLGVNTTTILASAGIIGLSVSIGAKDLISDILAGVAIVFEGEFRTGDIIEINGFRGEVQEIGIRTTKVLSQGNVKVYRNSEVSGVINLTQRYSIAQAEISINRKEKYEAVEKAFLDALPRIGRHIPMALEEVELCGITSMNNTGYCLKFQTKCREHDRAEVESMLRKELLLVMERNDIDS